MKTKTISASCQGNISHFCTKIPKTENTNSHKECASLPGDAQLKTILF